MWFIHFEDAYILIYQIEPLLLFFDPRLCRRTQWITLSLSARPSVTPFSQDWLMTYFWLFCMKLGFNKYIKVAKPIFFGKIYLCLKWGKWGILRVKINIFELFHKFIRFFQNCTGWQALKLFKRKRNCNRDCFGILCSKYGKLVILSPESTF